MQDIDWGQVIFLLLVVIVGFVRWITNLIQQQKDARERDQLTTEERARREAAWRRQVGQDMPREESDPFRELKELFEQFNEPPKPAKPAQPPPLPARPQPPPQPVRAQPPPMPASPPRVTVPSPVLPKEFPGSRSVQRAFTEATALRDRPVSARLTGLRKQLATPSALQQAVLFREILGPPKALTADWRPDVR